MVRRFEPASLVKEPRPQVGFRYVTQRLSEDRLQRSLRKVPMKRDRERLFLSGWQHAPEFRVTSVDGVHLEPKTAECPQDLAGRLLPDSRHDARNTS